MLVTTRIAQQCNSRTEVEGKICDEVREHQGGTEIRWKSKRAKRRVKDLQKSKKPGKKGTGQLGRLEAEKSGA